MILGIGGTRARVAPVRWAARWATTPDGLQCTRPYRLTRQCPTIQNRSWCASR